MDIMMPEMDGYETTPHRAATERVPLIADYRAHRQGDEGRPRKMSQPGASDYVTKPVDLEQLFSVLRVWISKGHEASTAQSVATGGSIQ